MAIDWTQYHQQTRQRPARELLQRTLRFFELEGAPPGVAVDLGAGTGPETTKLLERGWTVHAVDASEGGLQMLRDALPAEVLPRLHLHVTPMERFVLPRCDLVWAGWSLPFCREAQWPRLLRRIERALRPGGRFAGDFFGPRHEWAPEPDTFTIAKTELRRQLATSFRIEAFDIEDGWRVSGAGRVTRWHAFGVTVRKPKPG